MSIGLRAESGEAHAKSGVRSGVREVVTAKLNEVSTAVRAELRSARAREWP